MRLALLLVLLVSPGTRGQEITCIHCPEYVQASAQQKEAVLWGDKISTTEYNPLPDFVDFCESEALLASAVSQGFDFGNQFDRFSDERTDIPRFFHHQGIVANVRFVSTGAHSFTGMFQGGDYGVLRFSPLAPIMTRGLLLNYFVGTFFFSFALKLFRSGMHSGNFLTGDDFKTLAKFTDSRSIWDLPNFNIFSRPVNNLASFGGENGSDIGLKFEEFEKFAGVLSVAELASYDQDGNEVADPVAPIIVQFEPNPEVAAKFSGSNKDYRRIYTSGDAIPVGTTIYSAWTTVLSTTKEPSLCVDQNGVPQVDADVAIHCPDQELVKLGDVVTKSRFQTSEWADRYLLFQHTRMCPKNQSVCRKQDSSSLTLKPEPSYSQDTMDLCISDSDKESVGFGVSPACPAGTSLVESSNSCFGNRIRGIVDETQRVQCPFMDRVNNVITNAQQVEPSDSCSFFSQTSNSILYWVLFFFTFTARRVEGVFNFFGQFLFF